MKILVIDDNETIRAILPSVLDGRYDVVVMWPPTVHEVIRLSPDLILLDILMPGLSGYEFLRQLRQEHLNVPVVAVTVVDADVEHFKGMGFCGYVRKPISIGGLFREIERCLGT